MAKSIKRIWILVPDLHFRFEDPSYVSLIKKVLKSIAKNPLFAGVVQLGDFGDFWQISEFDKDPTRKETVLDDLLLYSDFIDECQSLLKKGTVWHQLEGNHEKRLKRYTAKKAPEIYKLVKSMPEVLNFQFRNKENHTKFIWHDYNNWNSCIIGKTIIHHGFYFGEHVAAKNLSVYPYNFICGHTHRLQYVSNGHRFSCTLGHGSDSKKTMHTPLPSTWEQAFGVLFEGNFGDSLDVITVKNGRCILFGEEFEA